MNIQALKATVLKYRVVTLSLVVAVVLGGGLLLRHGTFESVQAELEAGRQDRERLSTNINNAALLEDQLKAIQEHQKAIEGRLISPAAIGDNQGYFYKIEAETGVKFLDLRQNVGVTAKGFKGGAYVPVSFSVSLRGSFANALTFLRRLENGSAYSRILTATTSRAAEDEKNQGADVILNLTVELLGRP